jgi:malonate-semialdehyde dehydrogenase (acetylating)/methylmalonate-semialdehyde dehydrogenase
VDDLTHWIGGGESAGSSVESADVFNPATGQIVRRVVLGNALDVDAAVQAAAKAFDGWSELSLSRRTGVLFSMRELLRTRHRELAAVITEEHGKVYEDALGEVARGAEVVEFACGLSHLLNGSYSHAISTAVDSFSLRRPLGVSAIISPFNFPVMVPLWFVPIAIAAGNSVVLKPSEKDPSATIWLARLWREAGLPGGVFNVVNGDGRAATSLVEHPGIASVSFVGSTAIARSVFESASKAGKRVQALGGAKNHLIVMADADVEDAADAIASGAFGSAGERCMAVSVVVAVGDVADELVARVSKRARSIRVGEGRDEKSQMGPLITRAHRERVASYIDCASREGATVCLDGRELNLFRTSSGFWLGPTVIDGVSSSMTVYREEIFGPVLSVVRVPSLDSALELLSQCEYGNGASIFTRDGATARRFYEKAPAGMIGVNVPIPAPMAFHSFGGWKSSLFGDAHAHGTDGFRFFTRGKVVTQRWPESGNSHMDLRFPVAT